MVFCVWNMVDWGCSVILVLGLNFLCRLLVLGFLFACVKGLLYVGTDACGFFVGVLDGI